MAVSRRIGVARSLLLLGVMVVVAFGASLSSIPGAAGDDNGTTLHIEKVPRTQEAPAGSIVYFSIDVSVINGVAAQGLTISDTLPPGMSFVGTVPELISAPVSCAPTAAGFECKPSKDLDPYHSYSIWYAVKITGKPGTIQKNVVTADATNAVSETTADATVTVTGAETAQLDLSKRVVTPSSLKVLPGHQIEYKITIANHGPGDATDLELIDVNPAPVDSAGFEGSAAKSCHVDSLDSSWVFCRIKSLAFADSLVLDYEVNVPKDAKCGAVLPNTVRVEDAGYPGADKPTTGKGYLGENSTLSASAAPVTVDCPETSGEPGTSSGATTTVSTSPPSKTTPPVKSAATTTSPITTKPATTHASGSLPACVANDGNSDAALVVLVAQQKKPRVIPAATSLTKTSTGVYVLSIAIPAGTPPFGTVTYTPPPGLTLEPFGGYAIIDNKITAGLLVNPFTSTSPQGGVFPLSTCGSPNPGSNGGTLEYAGMTVQVPNNTK
jgi:uncharacterized repeat protein (TIGR01451 family)